MERVTTGVKGLDDMIEGGLIAKSINLVVGEAGAGKSTFSTQFLIEGAGKGETGLYVSVEEKKDSFYRNMTRFGFDLQKLDDEGSLIFHKASVSEVRSFLDQGLVSFEQYFRTSNVKRLVIDSATALMLPYNNETSQRNAIMNLVDMLAKWDITVLITSEADNNQARFGIEYLVDSIFKLYYKKVGQERVRSLEIYKMRGTDHSHQEIVYRLGDGGIILYPGEKILL
jgi:KaiC/GvpD/RAD55 family RecA-like ATPase